MGNSYEQLKDACIRRAFDRAVRVSIALGHGDLPLQQGTLDSKQFLDQSRAYTS